MADDTKALRDRIKTTLKDAGLERFAGASGAEALLIDQAIYTWDPVKLEVVLSPATFDIYCPRKPDSQGLRAYMEALKGETNVHTAKLNQQLPKCAKVRHQVNLEVRAPAAIAEPEKAAG